MNEFTFIKSRMHSKHNPIKNEKNIHINNNNYSCTEKKMYYIILYISQVSKV